MSQTNYGWLPPKITESTYIFGSSPLTSLQKVLQPDSQWLSWLPDFELQRDRDWTKANYGCVSYSNNNSKEILFKRFFNYEINIDDRDLVVGSGTVPYCGNDVITVAEWHRNNGFILERTQKMYNTIPVSDYYKWERDQSAIDEAAISLDLFTFGYELLRRPSSSADVPVSDLIKALKYAPLQVTVDGRYQYDENGYVYRKDVIYSHEVVLVGFKKNEDGTIKHWWAFDCCNESLVKFHPEYRFGWPLINTLIPKTSMKLYRKKGEAAIYFLNPEDEKLVAYADGVIPGGSLFKIFFGDYKYAPIEVVEELPYQIGTYQITTK